MTASYTLPKDTLASKIRVSNCTVAAIDATGKTLGCTGGAASYGQTVKSNLDGYARKAQGMIKRGYYKGAVKLEISLSTYDSETQTHTDLPAQTVTL